MSILIIIILITVVLALNILRFTKYRNKLEPNSQIIVDLMNSLNKTTNVSKKPEK